MAVPLRKPASDLVDISAAVALRDAVGGAAFAELAADALFETEERLARIEREVANGCLDAAARLAHDLSAVAGSVGMVEISAAAMLLERACLAGDPGAATAAWRRLDGAGGPSLAAARALFAGLG